MTYYSQLDKAYASLLIGTSSYTIGRHGSAIVALACLTDQTPKQVNDLLKAHHSITGALILWPQTAATLGLGYSGITTRPIHYPCIGETVLEDGRQYFVVLLGNNDIIDPLDGKRKECPYALRSYRNVTIATAGPVGSPGLRVPNLGDWPRTVTVIRPCPVRSAPHVNGALSGSKHLKRGKTFTGVREVPGDTISGNNRWIETSKGNFLWSGNLKY